MRDDEEPSGSFTGAHSKEVNKLETKLALLDTGLVLEGTANDELVCPT